MAGMLVPLCHNLPMASDVVSALERLFARSAPAGVISVYSFGSQSNGRAHRESDVDVAVLLDWQQFPDRQRRFAARLHYSGEVGRGLGRNDVDLVVLNDVPPQLARAIVTRGQRVYCRDLDVDHAFVRDAQLRAADLEPFLRRTRRVKLAAILR
jgi:predicted nucleotidyltransferase